MPHILRVSPSILAMDTAHIDPPKQPGQLTRIAGEASQSKCFTIHKPRAIEGSQRWNFSYKGNPVGQVYCYLDDVINSGFTAKLLTGEWKQCDSFLKAEQFIKESF